MPMMHKKNCKPQFFHMIDCRGAVADGWSIEAYTMGEKTELPAHLIKPGTGTVGPGSPPPSEPKVVAPAELPGEASLGGGTVKEESPKVAEPPKAPIKPTPPQAVPRKKPGNVDSSK